MTFLLLSNFECPLKQMNLNLNYSKSYLMLSGDCYSTILALRENVNLAFLSGHLVKLS